MMNVSRTYLIVQFDQAKSDLSFSSSMYESFGLSNLLLNKGKILQKSNLK